MDDRRRTEYNGVVVLRNTVYQALSHPVVSGIELVLAGFAAAG